MDRREGFYWVKFEKPDEWWVAWWTGASWEAAGYAWIDEEQLVYISPDPIPKPENI